MFSKCAQPHIVGMVSLEPWDTVGVHVRINLAKKSKKKLAPIEYVWRRTWKKFCRGHKVNLFEKIIYTTFPPNSTNFTKIGAHFVACMMEFSCILAIPCSENGVFLKKKI